MRKVFLTPKMVLDKVTGKKVPKRNKKGEIEYHPDWRAKLLFADGSMTTATYFGMTKTQAQERHNERQAEQNKIRRGDIELPDKFNKQFNLPFAEVVEKFIRKGKSEGGRRNHPWSEKVAAAHARHLQWWQRELDLVNMPDLDNCLVDVEDALLDLIDGGKSPKTRNDYLNSLFAFCTYAKDRKFLREHPLLGVTWLPHAPSKENRRRDWSEEELFRLLNDTPLHRMIVYETAAFSGFRRGELASLTLDHLDVAKGTLKLHEEDDKARIAREQPIPMTLVQKLKAFGESGEALRQYERHTLRRDAKMDYPENPLLFVPMHAARMLTEDLERLGIPKRTEAGKLDFHSLRVAYTNLLFKTGADVKTAQELARHSDARLTLITYGRAQAERKHATVEAAYDLIHGQTKSTIRVQ